MINVVMLIVNRYNKEKNGGAVVEILRMLLEITQIGLNIALIWLIVKWKKGE